MRRLHISTEQCPGMTDASPSHPNRLPHVRAIHRQLKVESNARRQAETDIDLFFELDGYFKRLSPAFTRALGWSIEELLARPLSLDWNCTEPAWSTLDPCNVLHPIRSFFTSLMKSWKRVNDPVRFSIIDDVDASHVTHHGRQIVQLSPESVQILRGALNVD